MDKEQQIQEMAVIGCVRNPQAHTAEECAKCDFKNGQCNSYRHAEALYNAGYRKTFTSDFASDFASETQKAYKEGYIKGSIDRMNECKIIIERNEQLLKSNAQIEEILSEFKKPIDKFIKDREKQAVKEFAEKLKMKAFDKDMFNDWAGATYVVLVRDIDELFKECEKGERFYLEASEKTTANGQKFSC